MTCRACGSTRTHTLRISEDNRPWVARTTCHACLAITTTAAYCRAVADTSLDAASLDALEVRIEAPEQAPALEPSPDEAWAEHLRQEALIAEKMRSYLFSRPQRYAPPEPGRNGLGALLCPTMGPR